MPPSSAYVWSVLGAVAHVTERVDLCTYVTCQILRNHAAVVTQKLATVQVRPYWDAAG